MTNTAVSVVVPSYNGANILPALCRSLRAQAFADLEVPIGDNASTDKTHVMLTPFLSDARFRMLMVEVHGDSENQQAVSEFKRSIENLGYRTVCWDKKSQEPNV